MSELVRTLFHSPRGSRLVFLLACTGALGFSSAAADQFGPAPSFGPPSILSLITNPQFVAVGDLNHDGKLDLVIAVESISGIYVLMGDGLGGFTGTSPIGVGTSPVCIAIGDLNGDTHPDLVVTNSAITSSSLSVLLGDGSGGFASAPGSPIPLAAGSQPYWVAIAAMDADTVPDLVVANSGLNTVSILKGTGGGAFGPATNVPAGLSPRSVAVADLNNDGYKDLVVANFGELSNNVSVFRGNATGFDAPTHYATGQGSRTVALTDLNADGKLDAVVANVTPSTISVLLGSPIGDGTFQPAASYAAGMAGSAFGINVGDFNVDGKVDVMVTNLNLTTVNLFNGNGQGALQPILPPLTSGNNPIIAGVGDFNGDGQDDFAVSNYGSNNVSVFLNTATISADLAITQSGPAGVVAGQNVVYTTTVTNNGPNKASAVSVANLTPSGLTFVSNSGACTKAFPCALGKLNAGQSQTITSTFLVPSGYAGANPILNTATVSSSATDPIPGNNTQTASTPVNVSANLGITKSGPSSVTAGQNVVYTITVTNAGPSNATAVSVADLTPSGLTFVSNSGACTSVFPCALGTLNAGQSQTVTSTFLVPSGYAGSSPILNTATVSSSTTDPTPGNNTQTASTPVNFTANLGITKSGPASVSAGQNVVYTITVTNNGPNNASAVSVVDPTPSGLPFVSNSGACTTAFPCALGTLNAGQSQTVTSTFLVPSGYAGANPILNTATVSSSATDPTPANNTQTASTPVNVSANLGITKTGPASVTPGRNVVYTITVTNAGPSDASAVSVADLTPSGLTFVSNSGACTTIFPCALGTLSAGQSQTVTSTFLVPSGYAGANPILNTATVSSSTTDPTPGNNSSTVSTSVGAASADLSITKVGPANARRGSSLLYTITVTNAGPSNASAVSVADPTPAGLTFVSNSGACTTAFPCTLGTIPAGASRTITSTFDVPPSYAGPEPVVNSASVSSSTADPDSSNNTASTSAALDRLSFNTLEPCRVLDTRDPAGPLGGPALDPGAARVFAITGACGVPGTARAVSVNITVTQPTQPGDLRLYPAGSTPPLASAINYGIGQTRANNAVIPLGAGGALEVVVDQAAGTVHFILDVNGYFER